MEKSSAFTMLLHVHQFVHISGDLQHDAGQARIFNTDMMAADSAPRQQDGYDVTLNYITWHSQVCEPGMPRGISALPPQVQSDGGDQGRQARAGDRGTCCAECVRLWDIAGNCSDDMVHGRIWYHLRYFSFIDLSEWKLITELISVESHTLSLGHFSV